jgi:hypothetical protein
MQARVRDAIRVEAVWKRLVVTCGMHYQLHQSISVPFARMFLF